MGSILYWCHASGSIVIWSRWANERGFKICRPGKLSELTPIPSMGRTVYLKYLPTWLHEWLICMVNVDNKRHIDAMGFLIDQYDSCCETKNHMYLYPVLDHLLVKWVWKKSEIPVSPAPHKHYPNFQGYSVDTDSQVWLKRKMWFPNLRFFCECQKHGCFTPFQPLTYSMDTNGDSAVMNPMAHATLKGSKSHWKIKHIYHGAGYFMI